MIVPKRFVSICARKSDIGVSSTDERLPYPALLITTSSEPKAPIAAFTALAAADSSVTSSAKSLIWSSWRSDRSCRDSRWPAQGLHRLSGSTGLAQQSAETETRARRSERYFETYAGWLRDYSHCCSEAAQGWLR